MPKPIRPSGAGLANGDDEADMGVIPGSWQSGRPKAKRLHATAPAESGHPPGRAISHCLDYRQTLTLAGVSVRNGCLRRVITRAWPGAVGDRPSWNICNPARRTPRRACHIRIV
ncbi:hypothetical protein YWS52_27770 [Chitiniphilus shinanonensis]